MGSPADCARKRDARLTRPGPDDAERIGIVADDFTGACDAAGGFAAAGIPMVVLLAPPRPPFPDRTGIAVDIDARDCTPQEARRRARRAGAALRLAGCTRFLAKIDSTLRGEVRAVILGTLEGTAQRTALVAPAFPEQGRLVIGGRLHVARNQAVVTRESLLLSLGPEAAAVGAETVRRGPERLLTRLAQDASPRLVVVDADEPQCLVQTARAWLARADVLLAGSAGVARHAAAQLGRPQPSAANVLSRTSRPRRGSDGASVLVVAGSPTTVTRQQLARLQRALPTAVVHITPGTVPASLPQANASTVLVVRAAPSRSGARDAGEHAQAVADACAAWAVSFRPDALVLVGGATARRLCERLGVQAVRIGGEMAPGIPYGVLVGGIWDGLPVVTKAGGFGPPELLVEAVRALGRHKETPRT